MKVYLAARYSRREELCVYRKILQSLGYTVQARWLDGKHQITSEGVPIGDNGEALIEAEHSIGNNELRAKFAQDDWEDVTGADIVINFTEPPRSNHSRGGRHVEYGIALALQKRTFVVGYRENLFHWLPTVDFYKTFSEVLERLTRMTE
ncbi:MAG: hypothetical protein ABSG90_12885 [Dehalococcoidia bacterium]|jgi:hypothetical protein